MFVEFHNIFGISIGTDVYMRGVNIGYVQDLKLKSNTVIILIRVNSINTLIPKNSIVEITQIGLLKSSVIDVIPLETINIDQAANISHFSQNCYRSNILCNYHHLYGERGINYDDLIRAATRISQRLDDPRFFNLCYTLFQKLASLSSLVLNFSYDFNKIVFLLTSYVKYYFTDIYS